MPNPVRDALDYSMAEGESIRIRECWKCYGMGSSKAVQITRMHDGFIWYCFRCEVGGGFDNTGLTAGQAHRALEAALAGTDMKETKPRVVTMPPDFTKLNPQCLVELWKYDIEEEEVHERFNLGYSPVFQRLVVPVYRYGMHGTNGDRQTARRLVGLTGRDLTGTHSSKWHTVRQSDIKHLVFVAPPEDYPWDDDTIVLVEDPFSAIKVSMAGYLAVATLTTYVPYELYNSLTRFKRVIIWYDSDALSESFKHMKRLCSYGINASNRWGGEDPKYHSIPEIYGMIENPMCYEINGPTLDNL